MIMRREVLFLSCSSDLGSLAWRSASCPGPCLYPGPSALKNSQPICISSIRPSSSTSSAQFRPCEIQGLHSAIPMPPKSLRRQGRAEMHALHLLRQRHFQRLQHRSQERLCGRHAADRAVGLGRRDLVVVEWKAFAQSHEPGEKFSLVLFAVCAGSCMGLTYQSRSAGDAIWTAPYPSSQSGCVLQMNTRLRPKAASWHVGRVPIAGGAARSQIRPRWW